MSNNTDQQARWLAEYKAIRAELGWTQAELAELMGTSRRGVQDIEAGITPIRKVHLLAIRHLRLLGDLPA